MEQSYHDIQKKIEEVEQKLYQVENLNTMMSEHLKMLSFQYDITRKFSSVHTRRELFQLFTKLLRTRFNIEEFAIFLYDSGSGLLTVAYSHGLPRRKLKETYYRPEEGFVGKAFSLQKPIYLPDVKKLKEFNYFHFRQQKKGSVLYIPIRESEHALGVLKMRRILPNAFSELEKKLLNSLSEPLFSAITRILENETNQQNSWFDEETGIYNRKHFLKLFQKEFKRAQRYQHSLSVVSIRFGQGEAGRTRNGAAKLSKLLQFSANILKENMRVSDAYARYDAKTLIILLSETNWQAGIEAAKKFHKILRQAFTNAEDSLDHSSFEIAVGISNYPADTIEPPLLLELALKPAKDLARIENRYLKSSGKEIL